MTQHDFADDLRGPDAPAWRDALERFAISLALAFVAMALGSVIGLAMNFG